MVYSNDYQQVRRLYKKDIRAVLAMIAGSVKDSELVKRTRAEILSQLDDYWVLEIDRSIAACVALHPFPEQQKGELACLYVAKAHEGQGFGRKLVAYVEQVARQRGLKDLFALSTQTFNFFVQKAGFHEVTADYLPDERRKRYEASGRNSKVLRKDLMSVGTAELPRV
jgi:amino-acid N-acetyltransferase